MVAERQRDAVPSEATPLIEHPLTDHDETQISPSFLRGTVITITVGLLLFIQSKSICHFEAAITNECHCSHEHINVNHGSIGYRRRFRRLFGNDVVQLSIPGTSI
jgi:hypothetical protein